MQKPLISIIIPVYNVEKYLKKCLDSVVNQTYNNLEIILVDDGSTDGSLKESKTIALKDKRIKVVSQQNKGVSAARNQGIRLANGEYIAFVDGDDIVSLNLISKMLEVISNNDADLVSAGYTREFKKLGKVNSKKTKIFDRLSALKEFSYNLSISFSVWGKLYKTKIVKEILFDEKTGIFEDYLFVCNYISRVNTIAVINDKLYCYTIRNGSALDNTFSPKRLEIIYSYNKSFEIIKNINSDLVPYFKCSYLFDLILLKGVILENKSYKYLSFVDNKINKLKYNYLKGTKRKRFLILLYKINPYLFYYLFNFYILLKSYYITFIHKFI